MTAATTTRAGSRWLTAARHMITAHLWVSLLLWGVLVLLLVVFHILMSGIIPDRALLARFGTNPATWFPFVVSIVYVLANLPVHVTSGGTRRSFIRANLLGAGVVGAVYAAVLFLLVAAERAVFGAISEPAATPGTMVSDSSWGLLTGQALMSVAAIIVGAVVAMAYYRGGGPRGTLLLIPAVVPLLAVIALVSGDVPVRAFLHLPEATAATVLASLAAIAVAAGAFHLITRRAPINPVSQS